MIDLMIEEINGKLVEKDEEIKRLRRLVKILLSISPAEMMRYFTNDILEDIDWYRKTEDERRKDNTK